MSEIAETFAALKEHKKYLRAKYGVECPVCKIKRPKTNATILMPGQACRVDRYRDPRQELTTEQWEAA